MQQISALEVMPKAYHGVIKEFYGKDIKPNTIVVKIFDKGQNKEVAIPFRFNGNSLRNADGLIRQLTPKVGEKQAYEILAEVQKTGWKLLRKDSRGNFLAHLNPDSIKLESNNCLVYKSSGLELVNSDGSFSILSNNAKLNGSAFSSLINSTACSSINSPGTVFRESHGCTVSDSTLVEFIRCLASDVSKSKGVKLDECNQIDVENSSKVDGINSFDSHVIGSKKVVLVGSSGLCIEEANDLEVQLCKDSGIRKTNKSKVMAGEKIDLKGVNDSSIVESTDITLENCKRAILEECENIKAISCNGLEIARTSDKENLRNLYYRLIKDDKLVLRWRETIPLIGKWFIPSLK